MEHETAAPETDLFGAPVGQIRERWGRRSFAKTKENQELVALLTLRRFSQKRIAEVLGCDEKTLRKHFSRELDEGADIVEAMTLQALMAKVRVGNATAINRMLSVIDDSRLAAMPKSKREQAPERPGKKRLLTEAAQQPTDGWQDLLN